MADRILGLVSDLSFTKATGYINGFLHRSGDETLRVKTVEEFMERMGRGMDAAYKSVSDNVLSEAGIDTAEGVVPEGAAVPEEARIPKLPEPASKESVEEVARRYNQGREEGASINVDAIGIPPEASSDNCVYVYVDDVLVKHQKEHRTSGSKRSSKFVSNTVACIQYGDKKYGITATEMREVFRRIMAVLVVNKLMENKRLIFITDGATDIKNHIVEFFGFRQYTLLLDWYHLQNKCYQKLSSALKCGKAVRDEKKRIEKTLQSILWAGNVSAALNFIAGIDRKYVKSLKDIEDLANYITRKQENIPCYALRKGLGLHNSSNPVEKENDLIVAQRQKGKGMAWSIEGSSAMATVTLAGQNNERNKFLKGMMPNLAFVA